MAERPLRVPVSGLRPGAIALPAEASHYVGVVHRLGPGEPLVLVDHGARLEAPARVVSSARGALVVEAGEPVASPRLPPFDVVLLQGLPKGDKMDSVVRDATELGVARVVPVLAARSVGRPAPGRLERWRRVALEAARQSGRGDLPALAEPVAAERAWALAPAAGPRLVLEPGAPPFAEALGAGRPASVALAVGPEGGWAPSELAGAQTEGWALASLGPFVMRTETAAAAALGALWALARA
ncbi:MAG TPA: RsmE family RNA methyltransferase [Polyangiaceae bacterium]|nr:RsmE family RNA methyltransferase [Polyangiaceae bacterium]